MKQSLQTDLSILPRLAEEKQAENDHFRSYLQQQDSEQVDEWVQLLDKEITPSIDCTICGNCCKTLMINVSEEEANDLSAHLHQSRETFDEQYIEKGGHGMMLINTIPCHFLHDNKCTVYQHRFAGCREFPGLHLPGINQRLFTIFMHYDRCPIIYNVVEELKTVSGFK